MIHIMLDLETWGTTPCSDLRSIGACVFDPVNGAAPPFAEGPYTFYIATDNPPRCRDPIINDGLYYDLERDPATVQWWADQSPEAQAAFADPVDLKEALERFTTWLCGLAECPYEHRLWSHGAAFDPPILAAAYRAVGLPIPWHYRAPRDTRTIFDAAGIEDHSEWLNRTPGPLGIPHHALDDAICQARAVCAAWQRLPDYRGLKP